jgi:hypothetical protein
MEMDESLPMNLVACLSKRLLYLCGSVVDPLHFGVDPDPDMRIHASD